MVGEHVQCVAWAGHPGFPCPAQDFELQGLEVTQTHSQLSGTHVVLFGTYDAAELMNTIIIHHMHKNCETRWHDWSLYR